MKKLLTFYIFFTCSIFSTSSQDSNLNLTTENAPSPDTISFIDKLFAEQITEMRIYMDFDTVIGKKRDKEYSDAFVVTLKEGVAIDSFPAEARARGVMRNDYCKFPPIKIKMKKKALRKAGLNDMNEFKLVVPCKSSGIYEKYILKEKLIYDLYNLVSPFSLRAHIVTIDYYDLGSNKVKESKKAIVIEDKEELAFRFNGKVVEREKGFEQHAQDELALILAVFQYMIGNTDYAYGNMHNVLYIYTKLNPKLTPVPFDFDYCGAIKTEYAIPNENLYITDVRTRYFQGICRDDAMILKAMQHFINLQKPIEDTILNFDALSEKDRNHINKYINGFFEILDNPKKALKAFKVKCK